jgi:cytochrome c-type biogenesis protein CcmE
MRPVAPCMTIASGTPGVITRVALSAVLIVAGVAGVHLAPQPKPPYKMVDEVMLDPAHWEGTRMMVHGWVVPGTITEIEPGTHAFVIRREGQKLRIWHTGVLPDTFRDQSEVVLTGSLEHDHEWVFVSDRVVSKCGGKYGGLSGDRSTVFQ